MLPKSSTKTMHWITTLMMVCIYAVTFGQTYPPVKVTIDNECDEKGSTVCVDFRIEGCTNIESLDMIISYNPNIIELIKPIDLSTSQWPEIMQTTFTVYEDFPGVQYGRGNVRFLFFEGDPVTLPDGALIFSLCFRIIGEPGQITPIFINAGKVEPELVQTSLLDPLKTVTNQLEWMNGSVKVKANSVTAYATSCGTSSPTATDGSITLIPTGGTGPYSYTINNGVPVTGIADGQEILLTNLPKGTYTIVVTDALGMPSPPRVIIIEETIRMQYNVAVKDPTCFHTQVQNGEIDINITDGGAFTPDLYKFAWSNFEYDVDSIARLASGQYSVTITDPAGCAVRDTFNIAATPITYEVDIKNATCIGKKDGTITIKNVAGGLGGPFDHFFSGIDRDQTTFFKDLGAGMYDIRVRDATGCSTLPVKYEVKYDRILNLVPTVEDVSCSGRKDGKATIVGSPNVRFNWKLNNIGGFVLGVNDTTWMVDTLSPGLYTMYVIDPDACRDTVSFEIKDTNPIYVRANVVQPGCTNKGSIDVVPVGGSNSFQITWDPAQAPNTTSLTDLNGGTFKITVTDNNGCSKDTTIVLNNAGSLGITLAKTDVTCFGKNDGRATVTVLSSQMISIVWKDATGNPLGPQTNTINNLPPGNYSVEVKETSGCSATQSFTITNPAPVYFAYSVTQPQCMGDPATIAINNTLPNATFKWVNTLNTAVILDTDNSFTGPAGIYMVTMAYGSGCTKDTTFTIVDKPAVTFPAVSTNKVTCFGLSNGQAAVMNPPPGLTFNWSTGTIGPFAINFAAGDHWVIAKDANGCASDTVYFEVLTFPKLEVDDAFTVIERPACSGGNDGSITVAAIGGSGIGYRYTWPDGSTQPTINNLGSGTYIVTISDDKNCIVTDTIVLTQPAPIVGILDPIRTVELDCNNNTGGQIAINIIGGNPGVKTISWQSGVIVSNNVAVDLSPGTYCATITDNKGCRDTFCYTLSAPEPLRGEINPPEPLACNGGQTCISVRSLTGGTGNQYTFQINNGLRYPIDSCVTVVAGSYFINFIDSSGCSTDTLIEITQPAPLSLNVGPDVELQLGSPPHIVNAILESATLADTFYWTPNNFVTCLTQNCQSASLNPTSTTNYVLTVIDQNGCTGSDELLVTVLDKRNVYFANAFSPNSDGFNDHFQAVIGPDVREIELFEIYDRWGNLVFTQKNYTPDLAQTDGWDGTFNGQRADPGVFVYVARVVFIDDKVLTFRGDVTLMDKARN
jgi:gliding motility-associated-like protein